MNITSFLPDVSLLFFIVLISIFKFTGFNKHKLILLTFSASLLITLLFLIQQYYFTGHTFFYGSLAVDYFGISLRILALIIFSSLYFLIEYYDSPIEHNNAVLYLTLLFALFISISSNNILLTYITFEVISLAYFIMLRKNAAKNINSFYRSWIISSSLMLFGISIFYGLFGSLNYSQISLYLSGNPVNSLTMAISVLMIFSGFAFRLFVFPLQSVIIDISERISIGKSSMILTTSAIAGFGGLTRFIYSAFNEQNSFNTSKILHTINPVFNWELFIIIIFCLTVLTSSLLLFLKKDLLKINLYIFLVNIPLVILGFGIMQYSNLSNITLLLIQTLIPFITITVIIYLFKVHNKINSIFDINGVFFVYPFITIVLIINLLSMAGLPLTLGFASRLYILSAISSSYSLSVVTVSVIASMVIYYKIFQMARLIFSKTTNGINVVKIKPEYLIILTIISLFLLIFGIFPSPLTYILNIISNIIYF